MGKNTTPATIAEKIRHMEKFLDLEKFIKGDKNDPHNIESYYKTNHPAYRRVHSKAGYMHFHVSKDGKTFSPEDACYQPDVAAQFIKAGDRVLELGSGQGANILHLAKKFPDVTFDGLDLFPGKMAEELPNLTITKQDYSKMPQFADNTFDVIYAIETLVHCSDKLKVLAEIKRVLKPGGIFVVFDYALKNAYETYDRENQLAVSLISKGGAAALIESVAEWEDFFVKTGFATVSKKDLTKPVMPDLRRLEHRAACILDHPFRAKVIFKTLPNQFVSNIILGYLGADSAAEGAIVYKEWVLKKD